MATTKWSCTAIKFKGTVLKDYTVELYLLGENGEPDMLFDTRKTLTIPKANAGKITSGTGDRQSSYHYNGTYAGGRLWSADEGDLGRQYYIVINYTDGETPYKYTSSAVASTGLSQTELGNVAFTFTDTIGEPGDLDAWVFDPYMMLLSWQASGITDPVSQQAYNGTATLHYTIDGGSEQTAQGTFSNGSINQDIILSDVTSDFSYSAYYTIDKTN